MAANPTTPLLSTRAQGLLPALVTLLVVVMLSTFSDVGVTALATQSIGVQYRFQVVGLLLASAPQLAVVLVLIAWLATLSGQRLAVRGASIAAIVIGVLFLILIPFFGLDFLQSRRMIAESQLRGFTIAGLKTAGFAGLLALLFVWAGWRGIMASQRLDEGDSRQKGEGLVVGQQL
ncbi:MAG TPA: hypothetical protein VGM20_01185 [Gemmatimonadales bacterium]|jgi:hypothetical protein